MHFKRVFLSKLYNVWAKKIQRSYVSWHWGVIQRKSNSSEIYIFCVMQYTWCRQWKILLKCRENLWQLSWMKFILSLICIGSPYLSQTEHLPKLPPTFLLTPPFWGYLNFQVRINKRVNSLDYHPFPLRLASKIHPSIFP